MATSTAILSIDQGSSGTRAHLYCTDCNQQGKVLFSANIPVLVNMPKEDWVEYSGNELLESVVTVIQACLLWAKDHNTTVSNIVMSCQRSTCAAWNSETGELLAPIISWQDRRANTWLQQQSFDHKTIQAISGLPISPHYGAAKLRWLIDNSNTVKDAQAIHKLNWGPLSAYLLFQLCGDSPYCVDANIASRTQLWDIEKQCWSQELCETFKIPIESLPSATPSLSHFGNYTLKLDGNNQSIPISLVIGDKQAELAALGTPSQNRAIVTLGTCSSIFFSLPEHQSKQQRFWLNTRMNCQFNQNDWLAEALINGSGAALQWFSSHYNAPADYDEMNTWINSLCESEKLEAPLFLNSVSGIASPFWRPDITPTFSKEEPQLSDKQYFYSLIESIAFWLVLNINLYHELVGHKLSEIILAGHLGQCDSIGQITTNVLNIPIKRASEKHYSIEGAARIVSESMHTHSHWPEIEPDKIYTPDNNLVDKNRYQSWKKLIETAL